MKKTAVLCMLATLLLAFSACGSQTRSYTYYEFVCEGDMTLTRCSDGDNAAVVLSDEDEIALLTLWGNGWVVGSADGAFDYEFAWENTTVYYNSERGVFRLGDSKQILELSRDDRKTVEAILDAYR